MGKPAAEIHTLDKLLIYPRLVESAGSSGSQGVIGFVGFTACQLAKASHSFTQSCVPQWTLQTNKSMLEFEKVVSRRREVVFLRDTAHSSVGTISQSTVSGCPM